MKQEGKYIYGILATDEAPNFGPIGIWENDEVVTIGAKGVAAVVSRASLDQFPATPESLKAHIRVIEKVGEGHTILPMRYGIVAESADEVVAFLEERNRELKNLLKDLDGKVEVGIKVLWTNMKGIYEELGRENRAIRTLKAKGVPGGGGQAALVRAGELVEAALDEKKAVEGEEYLRPLKKISVQIKEGELTHEDVVANASFLVDRDWVKEFDQQVEKISDEHNGRIQIKYVGPMPPFSFVNLEMHWNGGRR